MSESHLNINMNDPISNLINTYHELNAAIVDELDEEPSALEFVRYVANNRPFVVRRAAIHWEAVEKWNAEYLIESIGGEEVKVAITPSG
jgi:peptidyl-lysine (3S)-dioxygenase / protease